MSEYQIHATFPGRILMIGCGSIGQGTLPLILRHIHMPAERISIIAADDKGRATAEACGVEYLRQPLLPENYREILDGRLGPGDFLLPLR